jgi:uncharacterized membrane protein
MEQAQTQHSLNEPTAHVLVWGFRISATLVLIGLALTLVRGDELRTSLEGIPDMLDELAHGRGAGIVGLGILAMIVTPFASAISIVLNCFRIGDRRYALITVAVVIILAVSAVLAVL